MTENNVLHQSMTQEPASDGKPAQLITLINPNGMTVTLMDIGATWLSCLVPVGRELREVLLGVSTMAQFNQQQAYLGATVGRYANRINQGKFSFNGESYQVATNQFENCLHGGPNGFNRRRWKVETQDEQQVAFSLTSEDGDQGFPGTLLVTVSYTLTNDNAVEIKYYVKTDKACPVNLTNHGYFNLQGDLCGENCLAHRLTIAADYFLPTDDKGIPKGELRAVANTGFDFREGKNIDADFLQDEEQQLASGYDHSFLLARTCKDAENIAARAISPDGLLAMEVLTTKPAMQLYTGNFLAGCPNREGGEYQNYAGFALETQYLPDSPNHPEWPQESCILMPETEYDHSTVYRFSSAISF
ncbi:galactose-1-epimerase [Photobacterium sp. SDRW27]|uniref:galactose-1-epimerase n=1 Tax=Photobacterium obscurum TaxID=2829490 RepID=UPI002243E891|nr:galactose-1-epimerase [Photobacterium obscurum]MCW8327720.1 galactose-1-epimerase [Photobacterium obscurum]